MRPDSGNSHGGFCPPWRTLLLAVLCSLLFMIAGPAPDTLVYTQGSYSSFLSGHWVHSDLEHALWNIGALIILGYLFEPILKQRLFTIMLSASLLLSLWLRLFAPELTAYCGLSGILNALLVTGTLSLWQQHRSSIYLLILLLTAIKNITEILSQHALFTHSAWPSFPQAHIAGMLIGVILFLVGLRVNSQRCHETI